MPCAPDRSRKESTQVMLRRTCFVTEKPEPRMHPIRLRSFKLAALGTYARCGLRQPLVSNMRHIHPAQPTSLTTTSCTTARPRSPRRRSGPPVRPSSYRPQCSLAHRFACRPSRFSRLTRAAWAHIAQRREGPKMCSRESARSAGLLAQVGKDALLLGGDGVLGLLELDLGRGNVASHGGLKSLSVRLREQREMGTQRHSAALSGTQRHSAALSGIERQPSKGHPKGTPKQRPPAARPRRSCKSR